MPLQYSAAPRLVLLGGENAQAAVGALIVATETNRETDDRFLEPNPGDQDMLRHRLGDHAGVSVPQAIAQGHGISGGLLVALLDDPAAVDPLRYEDIHKRWRQAR